MDPGNRQIYADIAKRPYFLENTPEVNLALMRGIKDAMDPKHLLNNHISYLK